MHCRTSKSPFYRRGIIAGGLPAVAQSLFRPVRTYVLTGFGRQGVTPDDTISLPLPGGDNGGEVGQDPCDPDSFSPLRSRGERKGGGSRVGQDPRDPDIMAV